MSNIFIGTTGDRAGQSLFAWAMGRRLVEKGLKVGFIKPFGSHPVHMEGLWTDQDAFLFKEALNLREPIDRICPYLSPEGEWRQKADDDIIEEINSLIHEFSAGKDVILIMGSNIFFDSISPSVPDTSLITGLNADCILVHRFQQSSRSIYSLLSVSSLLKDRIKEIVINRVPAEKIEEVTDQIIPTLARKGVPVITALAEDPVLSFRNLREIKEILDGELLCGEGRLEKPIGGMTVGSADLKKELHLFKRVYNKIILLDPFPSAVGLEEPYVQRSVAGILLTGGLNPAPQILDAAEKAGISLMLVKDDTFNVLERLEKVTSVLSPGDEVKVRYFTELLDQGGVLDRIVRSFGIPS